MNKPIKILQYFRKADSKLLSHLSSLEKSEAVDQFKHIWKEQATKVQTVINRRQKVKSNRSRQELEQQEKKNKIAGEIKSKMKAYEQKRSTIQLEKLKNYRNMDKSWKNKMKIITSNEKKHEQQQFKKAQELNKKIEQFWQSRNTQKIEKERRSSSLLSKYKSSPNQQFFLSQLQPQKPSKNLFTQIQPSVLNVQQIIDKSRKSRSVYNTNFPSLEPSHRVRTQQRSIKKSNIAQKGREERAQGQKSQDDCLRRSNQHWQQREQNFFQKAMDKINKIMKARVKAVQKLKKTSQHVKENRTIKQNLLKRFKKEQQRSSQSKSPRFHSKQKISISPKRNELYNSHYSSQVRFKHKQIEEENYRMRTELFDREKQKQHRGRFHRMVKDAVNLRRLQVLRQKQ